MKAALLGLTHPHSGLIVNSLHHLKEVTAVALWDPDPAALENARGNPAPKAVEVFVELDRLLADPELVFALVLLPSDRTAAISRRVLEAGKHLITEKPGGIDSTEIAELLALAESSGRLASVLYPRRFHPCAEAARECFQAGMIGSLFSAELRFLTTQVRFRQPDSWLFHQQQSGGGILLWLGCHCLDLLHYITKDEITEVAGTLAIRSGEAIDVEDTAALSFRMRSGTVGTFLAGYSLAFAGAGYDNQKGYDSYLGLNGRLGRIVWPDLEPRLQIESPPVGPGAPLRESRFELPPSPVYGGLAGERFFQKFFAAIRQEGAPPTTLADALRTARIIEAAASSSKSDRFIKVLPTPFQ